MDLTPLPSVDDLMKTEMKRQLANFKRFDDHMADFPRDRQQKDDLCAYFFESQAKDEESVRLDGRKVRFGINFLPRRYPPCTKSLKDLKDIFIDEMALDIHNYGSYIKLRCCTVAVRSVTKVAVVVVVEDENCNVAILELYNQEREDVISVDQILDKNMVLVVKEPYFRRSTYDESLVIRVDHVTDMVVWNVEDDWDIPNSWIKDKNARDWVTEGKEALKDGKAWNAVRCFNAALNHYELDATQRERIQNERGIAYVGTGQFEDALADLNEFRVGNTEFYERMSTQCLTAICKASYHAGRFADLHERISKYWSQLQSPECLSEYTDIVLQRKMEQESGIYNFLEMQEAAANQKMPILDYATFVGSIGRQWSPERGNGIFATENIQVGDLLLYEKAFAYSSVPSTDTLPKSEEITRQGTVQYLEPGIEHDFGANTCLTHSVMHRISTDIRSRKEFMALHHQGKYEKVNFNEVDGVTPIDTFLVKDKIETNRFQGHTSLLDAEIRRSKNQPKADKGGNEPAPQGLFIKASYFNHSCFPSASWDMIGDMMIIRAARDIPQDEEILISYADRSEADSGSEPQNPQAAREHILETWNFNCDCVMCINDTFRTQEMVDEACIHRIRIRNAMEDSEWVEDALTTWEHDCYPPAADVPRFELAKEWTTMAMDYSKRGLGKEACRAIQNVFRLLAFDIQGLAPEDEREVVVNKWGLVYAYSPTCWLILWTCFAKIGDMEKAEKCQEYAKLCYKIWHGEDKSFEKVFRKSIEWYLNEGMLWDGLRED